MIADFSSCRSCIDIGPGAISLRLELVSVSEHDGKSREPQV
jgi:hypothetical protein